MHCPSKKKKRRHLYLADRAAAIKNVYVLLDKYRSAIWSCGLLRTKPNIYQCHQFGCTHLLYFEVQSACTVLFNFQTVQSKV